MKENKALICEKLCELLKMTRYCEDIASIKLSDDACEARIEYTNGDVKPVNVGSDSGMMMISDILDAVLEKGF